MQTERKDGVLTVLLPEEINAQSAHGVQEEIDEILKSLNGDKLVLDVKEMTYTSSAGLRVFMATQKTMKAKLSIMLELIYKG